MRLVCSSERSGIEKGSLGSSFSIKKLIVEYLSRRSKASSFRTEKLAPLCEGGAIDPGQTATEIASEGDTFGLVDQLIVEKGAAKYIKRQLFSFERTASAYEGERAAQNPAREGEYSAAHTITH